MTSWSHKDILAAARAIRSCLPSLVEDSGPVDKQIADLLTKEEKSVELDLVDVLTSTEVTRKWTEAFLASRYPPQATHTRFGIEFSSLSGPVAVDRYTCPHGDFDWFRFAPGDRPPQCPTHGVHLVLTRIKED